MIVGDMEIRLRADIARLQRDMDDARRIAGNAMDRIGRAAGAAKMAIGALAAGLSVAAFGAWIKSAIDAGDAANKLSAKTGIAVKDLAGLQMSFNLGGVSTDAMTSSMSRLSKGMVEGSKTLDVLKISTKNADGSFKSTRDVLYTLADKFAGMKDGAQKTALALELFGKSGAELIPMLNGGSEAMREMDAMAVKLGMSISEDAAKKAEEFNDTLDLLHMGSQGIARSLAAEMLPTLTSLAGTFLTTMTEGDKLAKTAQFLGNAFKILYSVGVAVVEAFKTVGTVIGGMIAHFTNVLGGFAEVAQKLIAGDFKGAVESAATTIRHSGAIAVGVGEDIAASWQDTGKTISEVWDGSGADAVNAMNKIRKASTVVGVDADTLAKQEAKRKKEAEAAEKALAKAREDGYKMQKDYLAQLAAVDKLKYGDMDAEIADTLKQAEANEKLVATFGMSKLAIEQASLARVEEQLAQADSIGLTEVETQKLQALIDAKKRNIAAVGKAEKLDTASDVGRAKELLDIMTQVDEVTKSAASSMADSFGRVGAAIGSLTTAISGYGRTQAAIAAQLAAATRDAGGDTTKIQRANALAAQQSAQAQIKSYGDMAGAAKGFFKEGTKGYGALQAAEKAFRAVEMAMAIQNMLAKSGLVTAFTSLFVTSKATETAATVATVAPDLAATATKGAAAATLAVAKQATGGDPYSAWARMAAMAASMAALGFLVSGGGRGGQTAEEAQQQQGTGSVFGDSGAKSNSLSRAIELATKNSSIELTHTAGMLAALKNIERSMAGFTNLLLQTNGVADGSNLGIFEGQLNIGKPTDVISRIGTAFTEAMFGPGLGGKIAGFINNLWGKTKQNIVDSGILFGGKVDSLQSGVGYSQYASVDTTKSSWFGLSKKTTNSVQTQGLDAGLSSQFGKIFTNLEGALKVAANGIGIGSDQVGRALDGLVITTTKLSLKGLTGDALTAAINAVISKTMDQMAQAALPGFEQFRKVGEGYAETVIRVSTNYANLDSIMESIGSTFGATGMASLGARERLIELAGGIETLASQTNSFAENFLTEAERIAPVRKYVAEQLASMGLAGVTTRDQFKSVVLSIDKTTAAGAAQYTQMLALADAFAKAYAATEDLTKSTQEIADERRDLLDQLDDLIMTSAQLLGKQRLALDASNRGLFDHVQAVKAAKAAQDAAKSSLTDVTNRMKTFGDSVRTFKDGLMLGNLSVLSPEQQYAEARRQYSDIKARALGGDASAQSSVTSALNTFLTLSQKINGGDAQYSADFAQAQADADQFARWAEDQVDVAQASLDTLTQQLEELSALNVTSQLVADAIANLPVALGVSASSGIPILPSNLGTEANAALIAEVKSLRAEVAGLRADQRTQTGDTIAGTAKAIANAAVAINEGTREAYVDSSWSSKTTKVPLA